MALALQSQRCHCTMELVKEPMSILLYTGKSRKHGKELEGIIAAQVPGSAIERFRDAKTFSARLRKPHYDVDVIVLLLPTRQDLEALVNLRELLSGILVIVIMPDQEHDTIAGAHRLYPHFLTFIDRGFMDVAAVLQKMLERSSLVSGRERGIEEGMKP